jgi:hypothetical protein
MRSDNRAASGDLSVEAPRGMPIMTRRRKTTLDDYSLSRLTWLFAWLVVIAAVAGLIGEVTH